MSGFLKKTQGRGEGEELSRDGGWGDRGWGAGEVRLPTHRHIKKRKNKEK
jgi:hypothetical protein